MKKILLTISVILAVISLSACQNGYQYIEGKVNIVATTTMLGDASEVLGGDEVYVKTLMNTGVDPHLYQPKASDTTALQKADLIIVNGLHLEGQMGEVLEKIDQEKILIVGDFIPEEHLLYADKDTMDPHIWFNVSLWKIVASTITDKLIDLDEDNTEHYEGLGQAYQDDLTDLHAYVLNRVSELSEDKRVLVTAHDAFNYFGNAYGFEVHAIQGISTESEASVNDIKNLANLVKDLDVKAIFVESSISQATINSVIEASESIGHTLVIGGELYSDSLGDESNNTDTYIKTFKSNVDTIVDALK